MNSSVLACAAAAALLTPGRAFSQATLTWDVDTITPGAQDGSGAWDLATANWWDGTNNLVWSNSGLDTAVFGAGGAAGAPGAITLSTTMNIAGLTFEPVSSGTYALSGGGLNVNGATPITVNRTAAINTAISGTGPVSFIIAPGLMLNMGTTTHTFSGGASVSGGGVLNLGVSTTTWSIGTGSITLDNGTIRWGNASNLTNAINVAASNTGTLLQAGNGTFSGALWGSGTVVGTTASVGSVLSVGGANSNFSGTFLTGSTYIRFTNAAGGSPNAVWVAANGGSFGCRLGSGTIQLGALIGASNTMLRGSVGTGSAPVYYEIGGHGSVDSVFDGILTNGDSSSRRLALVKVGANRTLTLGGTGTNNYTGDTIISAGTLALASSERISDSSALILNGGILATNGFDETALSITVLANSVIDLGDGDSVLHFGNSSALTWTGTLTIDDWSGSLAGGGTDQIYVGTDSTGLTPTQLSMIQFTGYAPGANILSTGEIVPVPEPVLMSLGSCIGLGLLIRRRARH